MIQLSFLTILEWIHSVLIFEGIYFIISGALDYNNPEAFHFIINSLWLFIPVIYSWILIRKINTLIFYILWSIPCILFAYFFFGNFITTILTILYFIIRCYVRIKILHIKKLQQETPGMIVQKNETHLWEIPTILDYPNFLHLSFSVISYFILVLMKRSALLFPLILIIIFHFFICFIHKYLSEMDSFINEKRQIANLPVQTLKKTGMGLLVVFVFLLVLFILPSIMYGKEPLTQLQLPKKSNSIPYEDLILETETPNISMDIIFQDVPRKEAPKWLQPVFNFIFYFMLCIVIVLFIRQLLKKLKCLIEDFSHSDNDQIISLIPDKEESYQRLPFAPAFLRTRNYSPNAHIRLHYKKIILKNTKELPHKSETPTEIEKNSGINLQNISGDFHSYYEKARYSSHNYSKKDFEHYRSL